MFKKILIRCDAAELAEVGTGHLYRSITISKFLKKKFKLKKKDILFIIKNYDEYKIAGKILQSNNINFYSIKKKIPNYSKQEFDIINKFSSNLIIIDRWGSITKKFAIDLKKKNKKVILIDDGSMYRALADLSINPLKTSVKKVKNSYVGHCYNILPAIEHKFNKSKTVKKDTIFLTFGGFDTNNLVKKTLNHLSQKKINYTYFVNQKYKKLVGKSLNVSFFKSQNHYKNLLKAEIIITAGGLSMFDAIYFNKKTVIIPQYEHQNENINILSKKKVIYKMNYKNFNKINSILSFFENKEIKKKQKQIINYSLMKKTFNLIFKCYER
jgi:spore coat polysaccharide biosynthesis predicted glycosyltransferase SpsG